MSQVLFHMFPEKLSQDFQKTEAIMERSSTKVVVGPFTNYVALIWVDGDWSFVKKDYKERRVDGFYSL